MLKNPSPRQHTLEMVILEDLVPADHLLRKIDKYIDFEFIRNKVRHLYCDNNGRPAIDPVLLFKMLFIGYLFGVRSERQLVRDVQVNVAYRWFLGLSLTDKIIDASTFSQQRRRRFLATDIEQQIFDEIVRQAIGMAWSVAMCFTPTAPTSKPMPIKRNLRFIRSRKRRPIT